MHSLLRLIQSVDTSVFYWFSQFHGSWFLDRLFSHLEDNTLVKSGLIISLYCYFWFRPQPDQQERRKTILAIFIGAFAGLVFARAVATIAPFRTRPMLDATLLQHPLSIPTPSGFVDWSSLPSDHAAYLGALAFGLVRLSRRLAVPVALFLALVICVPRLYLGIHYTSDMVLGLAIGFASVWAALQLEEIRTSVARPILAFMEAKPHVFYTAAFLVMYEMATLFWDLQGPAHLLLRSGTLGHHHKTFGFGLALFAAACMCGLLLRRLRMRRSAELAAAPDAPAIHVRRAHAS
jgi:membrane-associated phospholipid phosphatase